MSIATGNPMGLRRLRLLVFVLAALALSSAAATAGASAQRSFAPDALLQSTSHDHVLGLQPGASYASVDPVLSWNAFLGGSASDEGRGVAVDGNGNIYVAGWSYAGWGSPIRPYATGVWGQPDTFVAKLSPSGTLLWNTFLGGDGADWGGSIALDAHGIVYVAGISDAAWGSPVQPCISPSGAFVAKLSPDGALLWNTFMGSGWDNGSHVAADKSGNVYVSGTSQATWGSPVRDYSGGTDLFLAKLNSSGTRIWNTFLGGDGGDVGARMAVDANGNVYVAGSSIESWGSPRRDYGSGEDAFAAKLNSDGRLIWSTFLGGTGRDEGDDVSLDASGNVFVSGISNAAWGSPGRDYTSANDAFVAKLNSNGDLSWNTFLGGGGGDGAIAIAVGNSGDMSVAGYSSAAWGSPIRAYTGGYDAFAAQLTSSGVLLWNTFLGGSGLDFGLDIAQDGNGTAYVIGYGDKAWGTPVSAYTGSEDAFVARIEGIRLDLPLYLPLLAR